MHRSTRSITRVSITRAGVGLAGVALAAGVGVAQYGAPAAEAAPQSPTPSTAAAPHSPTPSTAAAPHSPTPSTAAAPTGTATGTVTVNGLNVRSVPTTHSASIVTVDRGFTFAVRCRVTGPSVGGNTTWLAVGPDVGKWVSGNYVRTRGAVPVCGGRTSVPATVTASPVLNSFSGPSIRDDSLREYQPGRQVRVRCQVMTNRGSGSTTWYLSRGGDWLAGGYVSVPRELPIC